MTQATYVQRGETIDYTPGADTAAGQVVVLGSSWVTVAPRAIASGVLGVLAPVGAFDFVKATGDVVAITDKIYWNPTGDPVGGTGGTGAATTDPTAGPQAGRAVKAAAAGDATVRVCLESPVNDNAT